MEFSYRDLGYRSKGEIVEVALSGKAANVRLLDSANFRSFKAGRRHHYEGGHVKRSPVRLPIPRSGHWYVTLDYGGYKGSGRWSVSVLPGVLPTLRETPLSSAPSLVRGAGGASFLGLDEDPGKTDDVFISHASEDKDAVVRPLAQALQDEGLDVWYDEFELRIGDSLRRKIDKGLANSRFGIVVLSEHFFNKGWPNYELDGLVTKAVDGEQVILPVWHNISKAQVVQFSPSLADKLARSTSTHTVEEISAEIAELVRGE